MKHLLVTMALLAATPAAALTFTETTDLPNTADFANINIGSLGVGTHDVHGTLQGECTTSRCLSGVDPFDGFVFDVAPGGLLTSARLISEGTGPRDGELAVAITSLVPPSTFAGVYQPWSFSGSNFLTYDVGPGTYHITVMGNTSNHNVGPFDIFGWSVILDVASDPGYVPPPPAASPVPLPASIMLLGSAFGALGLRTRLRKRA